jgi:hypothetical protein
MKLEKFEICINSIIGESRENPTKQYLIINFYNPVNPFDSNFEVVDIDNFQNLNFENVLAINIMKNGNTREYTVFGCGML